MQTSLFVKSSPSSKSNHILCSKDLLHGKICFHLKGRNAEKMAANSRSTVWALYNPNDKKPLWGRRIAQSTRITCRFSLADCRCCTKLYLRETGSVVTMLEGLFSTGRFFLTLHAHGVTGGHPYIKVLGEAGLSMAPWLLSLCLQ